MSSLNEIEVLKIELGNTSDLQTRGELLIKILRNYEQMRSLEGEELIIELLGIAKTQNNKTFEARARNFNGRRLSLKAQYTEAFSELNEALDILKALGDKKGQLDCYNAIGTMFLGQDQLTEALSYYLNSLKIAEECGELRSQSLISINIGLIYYLQGNFEEALKLFEAGRDSFQLAGDDLVLIHVYQNLGATLMSMQRYTDAEQAYLKGLNICSTLNLPERTAALYSNLGEVYLLKDEPNEALNYFKKSISIYEGLNSEIELLAPMINSAEVYRLNKDYTVAHQLLNKVLTIANRVNDRRKKASALIGLYQLSKSEGKIPDALMYYEGWVEINNEIKSEETGRKIASMQFEYRMEQKEHEIKLEREKKEELQRAYDLLDKEKQRSESLLLNILPYEVAEELKEHGKTKARLFDNVTVLFADFKNFTTISEKLTAQQLVTELHECFSGFDLILEKFGIEKIKTVGDAYLAISGLPLPDENHAETMVHAAIEIRNFMLNRKLTTPETFDVRVGLNSGSVVAGIVGVKKFAYDIWGDTVNIAARMEQSGEAGKVNISDTTYLLVKDKFNCMYRGEIDAKNKGQLKMYFVEEHSN